ncbi:MAG: ABC transporter ATP-binding protein [Fodinibius sp.]|nr:ABC transporter ATP-binding protein [Fodinibius sp.]
MSRLYTSINSAVGASDRIFDLLNQLPEVQDSPDAKPLSFVEGDISFKDVTFGYEEHQAVLKDISFEVKAGQTIAVVGPSGAGKTTLLNLIPRFFDPQKGAISIDGVNIKTIAEEKLASANCYCPPRSTSVWEFRSRKYSVRKIRCY